MNILKKILAVVLGVCSIAVGMTAYANQDEIIVNVGELDNSSERYYERITVAGEWVSPGSVPDYLDGNTYVEATNRQGNAGVFHIGGLQSGVYELYYFKCVHIDDDPAAKAEVFGNGEKLGEKRISLNKDRGWELIGSYPLFNDGEIKFQITKMTAAKYLRVSAVKLVRVRDLSMEEDYNLLDWKPVGGGYWNPTDSLYYDRLITKAEYPDSDETDKYVSSKKMFTREEIPAGSIIEIESGYRYWPEAWKGLEVQEERAEWVTEQRVTVDENWWGDYTYRAFNVSSVTPDTKISDKVSEVQNYLKIYVPKIKDNKNTLKILAIGNSFSQNAMTYLYELADSAGYENIVLGNLYIGGCTVDTHCENATLNKNAYGYQKNVGSGWINTPSTTLYDGLTDEEWDYITIQQASGSSGMADTYRGVEYLASYIRYNMPNQSAKIGWHLTWAYQQGAAHDEFVKYQKDQMVMYNAIINAVKSKILTNPDIDFVIPAGTAIQNVRTSVIGDTLNPDGFHLNSMGNYIAGMTWLKAVAGAYIDDISWKPSTVNITDSEQEIIKKAVNNACRTPYEVTSFNDTEVSSYAYTVSISENDGVTQAKFLKIAETEGTDTFVIAGYVDGKLNALDIVEEQKELNGEMVLELEKTENSEYTVKAFVFDSMGNIKPLLSTV